MSRLLSSELSPHIGQKVEVAGWLHKKRELGQLMFLLLRDRNGIIQIVVEEEVERSKVKHLQPGSILRIKGVVVETPKIRNGVELHHPEIAVEVDVLFPSPIEIDKRIDHNNLDTLFSWKVLNMRNPVEQGIWKIQAGIGEALRSFLKDQGFVEFHSPKLLCGSTEGGAEVFKLDYFGQEATLAQSAQFYKQMLVGSLERVYEFGSTYRAEPSVTTRHMTEFITVDVEMGFISDYQEIMQLIGGMMHAVHNYVWKCFEPELNALKAKKALIKEKIPQITLADLHALIFKETGADLRHEPDPTPFEERWICDYAAKNWGSEAVFVTEFPSHAMKFYHYQSESNPEVTERFDLLFRGVEIITGSRREHRYPKLIENLKEIGGDPEALGYFHYLQAFKYGMPSHGGFGLGLERLTQKIIGLNNVKEATLFPRDTKRLSP